jgi:hypothetical protein
MMLYYARINASCLSTYMIVVNPSFSIALIKEYI